MVNTPLAFTGWLRRDRTSDFFRTSGLLFADGLSVLMTRWQPKPPGGGLRRRLIDRPSVAWDSLQLLGRGRLLIEVLQAPPDRAATSSVGVPPDP